MTNNDKKSTKNEKKYYCEICNFETMRKSHYDRHLLTAKHINLKNNDKKVPKSTTSNFICECGKIYKHRQNLHIHKKKCVYIENHDLSNSAPNGIISKENIINIVSDNTSIKTLLLEQQKQLIEQQKQIAEQQKQLGELLPNIGNTINNNTNIKQKFNINIFLNEKCKGALNIDEFIK